MEYYNIGAVNRGRTNHTDFATKTFHEISMLQSHRESEMDFTTTIMMTVEVMMLGLQIDYSRFDSTAHDVIIIITIIIINILPELC
jgi:hypothetical protein